MPSRSVWRAYRRDSSHIVGVVTSFVMALAALVTLRCRSLVTGRPLVVISLVERLGDIVACEPVIRRIRSENQRAIIVWVGKPSYLTLFHRHPELNATIGIQCLTVWCLLRRVPVWSRLIDLHIGGRECDRCRIGAATMRPIGAPETNTSNYYNFGTLLESFGRAAGVPVERTDQPCLPTYPESAERINALKLPERFIVFHCSSEEESRNWERESWQELARHVVVTHGLPIVEVGITPVLETRGAGEIIDLCGRCSLTDTVEVIRRAELFVGIDSGPAHLANAARVSGVVLLGQYRVFKSYLPYTGMYADPMQSRIIHFDGPIRDLPLQVAADAVDQLQGARGRLATVAGTQMLLENRV